MRFEWTPARDVSLLKLASDGIAASKIAFVLDAPSRDAVLGRLFRLRHGYVNGKSAPRKPKPTVTKYRENWSPTDIVGATRESRS